jgi:hypothetical protein
MNISCTCTTIPPLPPPYQIRIFQIEGVISQEFFLPKTLYFKKFSILNASS